VQNIRLFTEILLECLADIRADLQEGLHKNRH